MLRRYVTTRRALPAEQFSSLREALLTSPLVGKSTLSGPFRSSRGFAVTFRGETGRREALSRFAPLAPWFDRALGAPAMRALTPWFGRVSTRVPNAWYLNVLMVGEGGEVTRHLDTTLREPAGVETCAPECVSVLYLSVPKARGGELQLWAGPREVGTVRPTENRAVHFRGDLAHAVRPFSGSSIGVRASLVIEQYHFDEAALSRLPQFQLDSRAGFDAFLKVHQQRPARQFEAG